MAIWGEITAGEILSPISGTLVSGKQQTILQGVSTDSRNIGPGELFCALKGDRFDGHNFAPMAIERGAAGIVVQKDWWDSGPDLPRLTSNSRHPVVITVDDGLKALGDLAGWWRHQHRVRVVAVTGSAGKSTTKEMTSGILELDSRTLKNKGNYNNLIGLPLTLLQLREGERNAVLEMGMNHPGEIARLTEISDPDVGIITNVGMAHLEGVGDLMGVVRAKWELAERISPRGKMVINGDDELLKKPASAFQKELITFGLRPKNDVRAAGIRNLGPEGISFDLECQGNSWPIRLKSPGLQNVFNALAASAAALCLNVRVEHIVEGLGSFEGIKGRFAVTRLPGRVMLVDDTYNANPLALKAVVESVQALVDEGGRIIVGLGEMKELGDASVSAHRQAGRWIAELGAHYFLVIGEHGQEMIKGAAESGMPENRMEIVKTHGEMVKKIREKVKEGDLIFLKGSREMGLEKVVEGVQAGCSS